MAARAARTTAFRTSETGGGGLPDAGAMQIIRSIPHSVT